MSTLRGPYPPALVAKVAEAVLNEHESRWATRDKRTDQGIRMACEAPGCEWSAERSDRGPSPWDQHRAHVGRVIAAELEAVSATVPTVTKPPMVMRSHRYPRKLYDAAMRRAEEREENLSDVLRQALERYVRGDETRTVTNSKRPATRLGATGLADDWSIDHD